MFIDQYLVDKQADLVLPLVLAILATALLQAGLMSVQGWAQLALRTLMAVTN